MVEKLKLMAVFPHPDDESLGLGGTLAKYSAEKVETFLVCATRGERGWDGPEDKNPGLEAFGRIREAELRCAASRLGLHELNFLDYIDRDVDQANPREIVSSIAAHSRRIRPEVVVAFAPGHDLAGRRAPAALRVADHARESPALFVCVDWRIISAKHKATGSDRARGRHGKQGTSQDSQARSKDVEQVVRSRFGTRDLPGSPCENLTGLSAIMMEK